MSIYLIHDILLDKWILINPESFAFFKLIATENLWEGTTFVQFDLSDQKTADIIEGGKYFND